MVPIDFIYNYAIHCRLHIQNWKCWICCNHHPLKSYLHFLEETQDDVPLRFRSLLFANNITFSRATISTPTTQSLLSQLDARTYLTKEISTTHTYSQSDSPSINTDASKENWATAVACTWNKTFSFEYLQVLVNLQQNYML